MRLDWESCPLKGSIGFLDFSKATLQKLLRELEDDRRATRAGHVPNKHVPNKEEGRYETPLPLVRYIAKKTATFLLANNKNTKAPLTIVDPATGDGRFVHETDAALGSLNDTRQRRFVSFDVSPAAPTPKKLSGNSTWEHLVEDALESSVLKEHVADLVIGNPPYVGGLHMAPKTRAHYQGRYLASSVGDWNLYGLFLEQGYRWLKPGGLLAMVVPSSWKKAEFAKPLRDYFKQEKALAGIVDFADHQVFSEATTYSSIVFLRKCLSEKTQGIAHATLHEKSWNIEKRPQTNAFLMSSVLGHTKTQPLLSKVESVSTCVKDFFSIYKGSGTGANALFVQRKNSSLLIQEECWRPVWQGRELGRRQEPSHMIALPYGPTGILLSPMELEYLHPMTWEYFRGHRDALGAREKGKFHGRSFYAFGRSNSLVKALAPNERLLIPDVFKRIRITLDSAHHFFLDSVLAVEVRPDFEGAAKKPLEALRLLLESELCKSWLSFYGSPLKGGYTRMTPKAVSRVPFPESLLDGDLKDPELLNRAFDIPLSQWNPKYANVSEEGISTPV